MQQPLSSLYCSNQAKLGCCDSNGGGCSSFKDNLWFWIGLGVVLLMKKGK